MRSEREVWAPTKRQIKAATAKIREGWNPATEANRRVTKEETEYTIPTISTLELDNGLETGEANLC